MVASNPPQPAQPSKPKQRSPDYWQPPESPFEKPKQPQQPGDRQPAAKPTDKKGTQGWQLPTLHFSPRDRRLTSERTWDREVSWADIGFCYLLYFVIISINPAQAAIAWMRVNGQELLDNAVLKRLDIGQQFNQEVTLEDEKPIQLGEAIAGYPVTSPRGWREHPVHGGRRFHEGVDLGTPTGTPLHAVADLRIACISAAESGGGGLTAEFEFAGITHQWLHLDTCKEGIIPKGQIFATTGNTGDSTGPHLDYRMHKGRKYKEPSRAVLTAVLTGKPLAIAGGDFVERYKAAISGQESGGNAGAVNHSGSGAMGKYQFMPDTAVTYAKRCGLALNATAEQLYADPSPVTGNVELQEQLMDCYVKAHLDQIEGNPELAKAATSDQIKCRMLAAGHYSGSMGLYDDANPQYWNGDAYPSIRDYTLSVCQNFQ